jgi:hypothetical protein
MANSGRYRAFSRFSIFHPSAHNLVAAAPQTKKKTNRKAKKKKMSVTHPKCTNIFSCTTQKMINCNLEIGRNEKK